jgi:hypothetical protein
MNSEPAFPNEGFNGWGEPFQGMTLRDYFAAKAMQAWESRKDLDDISDVAKAKRFYELADAMLKAREA